MPIDTTQIDDPQKNIIDEPQGIIIDEPQENFGEVFIPENPKWSLDEIILPAEVKEQLLNVTTYSENSLRVFELWGFKDTHKFSRRIGINLYGPPGTGKTMAAHAIARELGRKILVINYADIESKYVGETPKNIRQAFDAAKKSNSILFFDEADAILSKRVTNMTQAVDVSVNQTRAVMLMLMNEFQDFIIFGTNFIENFDAAFMRRISIHVKFTLPDEDCRRKLWQMYTPAKCPHNLDFDELAKKFDGISGSDISTATLNAANKAARQNAEILDKSLVFEAVENILESKRANSGINSEQKQTQISIKELVFEAVENILADKRANENRKNLFKAEHNENIAG